MGRSPPPPGHTVKLPLAVYVSAVKAAELFAVPSVGAYVERAIAAQLGKTPDRAQLVTSREGHTVALPVGLYASAVQDAHKHGLTVAQFVQLATSAQLARDRERYKVRRYQDGLRVAAAAGNPSPSPEAFGLPRDHGIPPAFRPSRHGA